LLLFSAIMTLLAGCGTSRAEKITREFDELLQAEVSAESVRSANDFLRGSLKGLDPEQAGALLLALEEYALAYDSAALDYREMIGEYEGEIPEYMTGLFEFKAIEQESPIISGAALQVSWAELLHRTQGIEDFIVMHRGEEAIKEDALWLYRRHVNAVLMGASNSPIFDYSTHKFSAEAKALYEAYASERPDTTLAWALTEYRRYLEGMDYALAYEQKEDSAKFFDTCSRIVSEAERLVYSEDRQGAEKP
jgi:hypothetical protein